MGTPKQGAAIVTTINAVRAKHGKPPLTHEQRTFALSQVAAMSQPEVRAWFKKLNKTTGFDRHTSRATPGQLRRIREIEVGLYGSPKFLGVVSFEEASAKLNELAALIAERRQGVQAVEAFVNHERPVSVEQ